MNSSRSDEQGDASYSDDFEHDNESQDSPYSEEKVEIKVFKSAVGSLTVHPKKVSKNVTATIAVASAGEEDDDDCFNDNDECVKTLSDLSLVKMKGSSSNKPPPATTSGKLRTTSGNVGNNKTKSLSMKVNVGSKASFPIITPRTTQGTPCRRQQKSYLAQEKIDPHELPASIAASMSSLSISRLSIRNRSANGFIPRGATNSIRRVVAHTSIKEKSYASAKFKTYNSPTLLRGSNLPPLRTGLGKPNTNVAQRVASAKRMTIMDLKSKIKLLQDEIEALKKENRFLSHLQHRQDNALRKWEGKDAELPKLLNQHKDEIRSLQEQLRRAQQHTRDNNEKLSVREKKILRLETEIDKLKTLVHEEHLQDRHTLQQDLDVTRMNLAGAEKRIREYMRHVEILEKNHRHQLSAQERKLIKVNTHTYELQQVVASLKLALRNKDRMLNYIQMRSSGRTLIRAFHAERVDKGELELLYGTSVQPSLNRPYHQSASVTLKKSHSFDCGNSQSSTQDFDEIRDIRDEVFSNNNRDINNNNQNNGNVKGKQEKDTDLSPNGAMPRLSSGSTEEYKVKSQSQHTSPQKCKVNVKSLQKTRSVVPCSNIYHGVVRKKSESKSESKMQNNLRKSPRFHKKVQPNRNAMQMENVSDVRHNRMNSGDHRRKKDSILAAKPRTISSDRKKQEPGKKKTVNDPANDCLENVESKEVIYLASTKGFKYEGPFVTNSSTNVECEQDSTEILYSPKSDKLLSERSLSSVCTSHTPSSSRSEEIISNIDILSARIRESCVLVPPLEEKFASPRILQQNDSDCHGKKVQVSHEPPVGPTKLNDTSQSILMASAPANGSTLENQFSNAILQPVQLVTHNTPTPDVAPQISAQSLVAPQVQLHSVLPVVPQQSISSGQFQLAHSGREQTNFLHQVTGQTVNNPTPQTTQLAVLAPNQTQLIDGNSLSYTSPAMQHCYAPVQTINVISSETQPMANSLTFQQHIGSSVSPRVPSEFQYFSFPNNSEGIQDGISDGVSIFQTTPSYQQQVLTSSPRVNKITHGPVLAPQSVFITPSTRSSLPRVGYNGEHSLPVVNKSKTQSSSYNPNYYVNLGSWK